MLGASADELQTALASQDWPRVDSIAREMIAAGGEDAASGWILRSQMAMVQGNSDDGVSFAEKAVKIAPDSVDAHINLGNACVRRIDDVGMLKKIGIAKKMKAAYERALEIDPQHPVALRSLIGFYREAPGIVGGDKERAEELNTVLWTVAPLEAAIMEVNEAMANEDYTTASKALAKARASKPDAPALTYQVGKLAALTGNNLQEGKQLLEAYLLLPDPPADGLPGHFGAHWRLGQIQARLGDHASARASFEKAIELNPGFENLVRTDLEKLPD